MPASTDIPITIVTSTNQVDGFVRVPGGGAGASGQANTTLSNGVNHNVDIPQDYLIIASGPTAAFSIAGFSGIAPPPGLPLVVQLLITEPCTLIHNSGSDAIPILTPSGSNYLLAPGAGMQFALTYDENVGAFRFQSPGAPQVHTVNAKDFGADPTVADNSSKFANAVAYLSAVGGGVVDVPQGTYAYATTIQGAPNVTFRGVGSTATVLQYSGLGDAIALKQTVNQSNAAYFYLEDIGVTGTNPNNVGACFDNVAGTYVGAKKCAFTGCQYGVIFDQTELGFVEDCTFGLQALAGVWLVNDGTHSAGADSGFTNAIRIERNAFEASAFGIIDDGGSVHSIERNTFDGILCSDVVYAAVQVFDLKRNFQEATYNAPLVSNSSTFLNFISSNALGGSPRTWVASTAYNFGSLIHPTVPNGFAYECTNPGAATATQPAWPTTIGATVVDAGGSTWKCISATGAGTGVGFSQTVSICHNVWQSVESCILYVNGESVPLEFSSNFLNAPNAEANVGGYIGNAGGLVQLDARNNYLNNAGTPLTTSPGYAQLLMNTYGSIGAGQLGVGPGVGGAPAQTVDVGGSLGLQSVTKATSYVCDTGVAGGNPPDCVVLCNQSGAISITLPVPSDRRVIIVTDKSGTANTNNVTILPSASETINGASSYVLTLAHASIMLQSDGTNWFVIGAYNGTVI